MPSDLAVHHDVITEDRHIGFTDVKGFADGG
jgi:hypothetical protein